MIKLPKCSKDPDKPTSFYFILTNQPNLFQHWCFWNKSFRLPSFDSKSVQNEISKTKTKGIYLPTAITKILKMQNSDLIIVATSSNVDNFGMYKRTIFNIFNFYAPIKKKYIRPDDASFMLKKKYITITNYIPEASNRH